MYHIYFDRNCLDLWVSNSYKEDPVTHTLKYVEHGVSNLTAFLCMTDEEAAKSSLDLIPVKFYGTIRTTYSNQFLIPKLGVCINEVPNDFDRWRTFADAYTLILQQLVLSTLGGSPEDVSQIVCNFTEIRLTDIVHFPKENPDFVHVYASVILYDEAFSSPKFSIKEGSSFIPISNFFQCFINNPVMNHFYRHTVIVQPKPQPEQLEETSDGK